MISALAHRHDALLLPDQDRVVARLFLPGEETGYGRSRVGAVVARVLALGEDEVDQLAEDLRKDFAGRHRELEHTLTSHAAMVGSHVPPKTPMSAARILVLGASVTMEYTVEGAALCNPSAVLHPDQTGLEPGEARVAVSLRCIGEGHISSLGFAVAVVGPGTSWRFEPRTLPAVAGTPTEARWHRAHLQAVLEELGHLDELAHTVLASLPDPFTTLDLQESLATAHQDLLAQAGGPATVERMRRVSASAYGVTLPDDVELSQLVLLPAAAEESNGIEDARFVRFVEPDGTAEYRATYTAYDGRTISPRLLISSDLRQFRAHRMAGPAVRNKGMALFPRKVGGQYLALCRSDGESTSIARSLDGYVWRDPELVQSPEAAWEVLQIGNCGAPIETDRGWLVLTHGVGPMRVYSIGAILLDLEHPTTVIARLPEPLLKPQPGEQNGYVPNVLYSCGGIVHEGVLWLPYGVGDARIDVAWFNLAELLDAMVPEPAAAPPPVFARRSTDHAVLVASGNPGIPLP